MEAATARRACGEPPRGAPWRTSAEVPIEASAATPVEPMIAGLASLAGSNSAVGFATGASSEAVWFTVLGAGAFLLGADELAAACAAGRFARAALPAGFSAAPLAPAGVPSPAEGARSVAADAFMPETSYPYIRPDLPDESGALRLLPARLIRPMDRVHEYRNDGRARRTAFTRPANNNSTNMPLRQGGAAGYLQRTLGSSARSRRSPASVRPVRPGQACPGSGENCSAFPDLSFHASASAGTSPLRVMFGHSAA